MAETTNSKVAKSEGLAAGRTKVQRGWFVLRAISGKEAKVRKSLMHKSRIPTLASTYFRC